MGKGQITLLIFMTFIVLVAIIIYLNLDLIWKMLYPLKYEDLVFKYADFFDNDPYLVTAIIYRESRFNPKAISSKGAMGLMQIMPDTARWIAKNLRIENFKLEDLYKPEINIYFGNWYLANLSEEFEGNLILILAAYNAGRGNVKKWLKNNEWSGKVHQIDQIPFPETKKFVSSVLNLYQRYLQLYERE
ncbi:lytic transglycosylase [Anoxybacter fermentans]|uniref:Lytic transglycosylase n=1 Tax=Anoxybacter fermentans TaxID=1323375 RepID=A0A3Q9HQW3_9FIRM|nr:lytic transglycosylase domain-containing protein [Anoxybacter fermentans]AZR73717.1 lytic transglycosylase [Anoxybacter fermentans]